MRDQGADLRSAASGRAFLTTPSREETPALIVGSGKGGVGKSVVSIALAATAAATGRRVLLVDGDQNLGNLHVLLGLRPALTPEAMLHDGIDPMDLLVEIAPGLSLVPADSGAETIHGLGATDRARLHGRVSGLFPEYDLVVVDAGAGLESAVRCAAMRATRLLLLTMPEPTALTDAYALLKIVHGELPGLPVDVVVNRVRDQAEGDAAFARLREAAERFLGRRIEYLGGVPEDPGLRDTLRQGSRLLQPASAGPALSAIEQLMRERLLPTLPALRAIPA